MELTEERVAKLKKAFGITTLALGLANAFANKEEKNDKLLAYSRAISEELDRSPIDDEYLNLLMNEYKNYMENYLNELINKDENYSRNGKGNSG